MKYFAIITLRFGSTNATFSTNVDDYQDSTQEDLYKFVFGEACRRFGCDEAVAAVMFYRIEPNSRPATDA